MANIPLREALERNVSDTEFYDTVQKKSGDENNSIINIQLPRGSKNEEEKKELILQDDSIYNRSATVSNIDCSAENWHEDELPADRNIVN